MNKVIATEHLIKLRNEAEMVYEELKDVSHILDDGRINLWYERMCEARGNIKLLNKILEK